MRKWTKHLVTTPSQLREAIEFLHTCPAIAVDTETTGLRRFDRICGVCLAGAIDTDSSPGKSFYIPVRHIQPTYFPAEKQFSLFHDPTDIFITYPDTVNLDPTLVFPLLFPLVTTKTSLFHNSAFDILQFAKEKIPIDSWIKEDTQLLMFLDDERRCRYRGGLKLENCAKRILGIDTTGETTLKKWALYHKFAASSWKGYIKEFPLPLVCHYGTDDVELTFDLFFSSALQEIKHHFLTLYQRELQIINIVCDMAFRGISVDIDHGLRESEQLAQQLQELTSQIQQITSLSINPSSSREIGEYLQNQGHKVEFNSDTGNPILDDMALKRIVDPICPLILQYRKAEKNKGTYIDGFLKQVEKDKIYPDWRTMSTRTGRFSSNIMQIIPKRDKESKKICRGLFRNPDFQNRVWVGFDLNQLQLRICAHVSNDPTMISIYEEDGDIHRSTAAIVFKIPEDQVTDQQRTTAKAVNFGVMFGAGPNKLREQLLKEYATEISFDEAKTIVNYFRSGYRSVAKMNSELFAKASRAGFLYNRFGRRRWLKGIERIATNFIIQSLEADMVKIILVRLYDLFKNTNTHILAQIHDEIIVDFDRTELSHLLFPTIHSMECWDPPYAWRVPIKVGCTIYGERWSEETESSVAEQLEIYRTSYKEKLKEYSGGVPIGDLITQLNNTTTTKLRKLDLTINSMIEKQKSLNCFVPILNLWLETGKRAYEELMVSS